MITRQADYAVRSVLDLALREPDEAAFSREIAESQDIPPSFLAKILTRLAAHAIVQTQRGVNGGVRLARPAAEITVLEVVEAIDGPLSLNLCVKAPGLCPRDMDCVVHPLWEVITSDLRERLRGITFAALAEAARVSPAGLSLPTTAA
ncbi:MAG: Rrf2 family transcriptional regulator [Anaerolineales bacterium]|nr:Rrf2 family transcriptional regulator [Anaerolineales bacterium]